MTTRPMSFCEVLEDEYRYFFGEVQYRPTTIEPRHVREIGDLAKRLKFLYRAEAPPRSRWWKYLADKVGASRMFDDEETSAESLAKAVLLALNGLLGHPDLLHDLLTNDLDARAEITKPQVWRALLRVPGARRRLLAEPSLASAVAHDRELLDLFAGSSAAVRVLRAEGFGRSFQNWPALLSTIADDPDLDDRLVHDNDGLRAATVRAALYGFFRTPPPFSVKTWWTDLLNENFGKPAEGERRRVGIRELFRAVLHPKFPARRELKDEGQAATAIDGAKLRERLGLPAAPPRPEHAQLTRFNAILLEAFYGEYLSDGQAMRSLYAELRHQNTAALCLSGGGIRSATFNLGILQGLADHRMLNRFHYISTVSGGGYIGSWLSSWMRRHREGAIGVATDISREPADPLKPEIAPIEHLRQYSSYLAPRATAFSLDSWTLAATYLRNLLLNWTMLVPAMAFALAVPRWLEALLHPDSTPLDLTSAFFTALFLTVTTIAVASVRPATDQPVSDMEAGRRRTGFWLWFVPLILSAFAFCIYWAIPGNFFSDVNELLPSLLAITGALGAVVFILRRDTDVASTAGRWTKLKAIAGTGLRLRRRFRKRETLEIAVTSAGGAVAGWLLHFTFTRLFAPDRLTFGIDRELYACLGVPLYLGVFFLYATLVVGLTTSFQRGDQDREWWARSAAALLLFAVVHALGAFAVLLLPVLLFQSPAITAPFGGISAIGTWLLSRQSKRSSKETAPSRRLMPLLRIAAAVTLLFLVAVVAIISSRTLGWMNQRKVPEWSRGVPGIAYLESRVQPFNAHPPLQVFGDDPTESTNRYFGVLRRTRPLTVVAFMIGAALISLLMSLALNVNVYSMHGMYRNRLIRAYLGASRWSRRPDPFTGFDARDNVEMWRLRPYLLWITSFIDFDAFAARLVTTSWWNNPAHNSHRRLLAARRRLEALRAMSEPTKEQKTETAAAVVEVINDLMRTWDLEHNVPAPATLQVIVANRNYLDLHFDKSLKKLSDEPALSTENEFLPIPEGNDTPDDLRVDDRHPLLAGPPLHIVNATLNMVNGSNLAWQERKAASFTISPLHSGGREVHYRDTAEFGEGISLGTAMAISGAAVSPNMGPLSSPAFTFLMTFFNARLGWWIGSPKHSTYVKASPRFSLLSLLREALGRTNADHRYVFLSDGGHFENLGIYEMVQRRCRYIVACDATADGHFGFSDLANAVRKVRIDLGIPIEPLLTKYIGPQKDERYGRYCALGEIRYKNVDGDGAGVGYLLYIKPCVYSDCPPDVRNYANDNVAFPHETTADQFFSESQFESYRALGRHIIGRICNDKVGAPARLAPNVPAFFANAWNYVHGNVPPVGDATVETVSDVVNWMATALTPDRIPIAAKEGQPAASDRQPVGQLHKKHVM